MDGTVALFTLDHVLLFSDFPEKADVSGLLKSVDRDRANYQFLRINNRMHLIVTGMVTHGDTGICLVTGTDVERVLEQQEQIVGKFGVVYAVATGTGAVLIFGLSLLITKPVKQLTVATRKIADGNYGERVPEGGGDEVGQLAEHFNRMAAAVEEKVLELSENARQKEDFVANFAHELKTPLTSVIGYADRIYQKELSREEQKKAAWHIWNEGMRLEALPWKLMDLTLLDHMTSRDEKVEGEIQSITTYTGQDQKGYMVTVAVKDVDAFAGERVRIVMEQESTLYDTLIPVAALCRGPSGYYVLVLQEDDSVLGMGYPACRMSVDLLESDETYCAVRGIPSDEYVIISATDEIWDGRSVFYEGI